MGTVFGTVPDGVSSEKMKKILNFLKMSFFRFLVSFLQNNKNVNFNGTYGLS